VKAAKKFDCVKMKDEVQAKLLADYDALDDREIRQRMQRKLAASTGPVGKLWRALTKADAPTA